MLVLSCFSQFVKLSVQIRVKYTHKMSHHIPVHNIYLKKMAQFIFIFTLHSIIRCQSCQGEHLIQC